LESARTQLVIDLLIGGAVSTPLALLAHGLGRITRGGALTGVVLGALVYASFYLAGLVVLGVALVMAIVASRVGHHRTATAGEHRGAANVLANCGVGALSAAADLAGVSSHPDLLAVWFVTAIAAGASDTVASEIGSAFGGTPRSFPSWKRVAPGTPGAVSLTGTLAGAGAAGVIAVPAVALWLIPGSFLAPVLVGATAGAFTESMLSTQFEERRWLNNHALNAINTGTAAMIASWLCTP
jgi:uncharacterized protein (TIGR00297 family)